LKYLPINLDVQARPCLVVGGGEVGQRKVQGLLRSGARVRLVSTELTQGLRDLIEAGQVELLGRRYQSKHLEGVALAFACADDSEINTQVSRDAKEQGIWVNVADNPELCSFTLPASIYRGDLIISVSTSGRSPALAARIRARLENEFGPEYERFLELMGRIRTKVQAEGRLAEENRELFLRLVDSDLIEALAQNNLARAEETVVRILGPAYTLNALGFKAAGEKRS